MRKHFILPALLAMLVVGAPQAYAQTATVVTQSGQRIRGQVLNMGGYDDLTVRYNGRDRQIPMNDVVLIDFVGNGTNIPESETARANQSSDGLVVLRNGRTVVGRLVDMQPNNQAVVSGQFGERTIPLNQVARIYFGATNNANGYDPYGNRSGRVNGNNTPYGRNAPYGQYGNTNPYGQQVNANNRTLTIPSNQAWTNTGVDVRRGEVIHFRARGNVSLSQGDSDNATPAGATSGRTAGNSPLPGVTGGMLIGRVGNGQPFAIGAETDVTMPANGRLSLGINDDYVGDNTGNFVVDISPR